MAAQRVLEAREPGVILKPRELFQRFANSEHAARRERERNSLTVIIEPLSALRALMQFATCCKLSLRIAPLFPKRQAFGFKFNFQSNKLGAPLA